ncbi:hypothetical protein DSM112329_03080 [Paraconexibacter sp. AEG42_29]|uniref:PilN domain-containing protein n=1 Tax=Paraconexibacter sp. AEG42_29 TaxID=2997339 RepID=A0AAU7AWY1_9ACTN
MKAVNLIPEGERKGAGGAAGRTGGAAYVLLAALGLVVVMLVAYSVTSKSLDDKKSELASIEAKATSAEAQATALAPYKAFAATKEARLTTVKSIAASRFDWAHAMHELGRTLPSNITLIGLRGTVKNGVPVENGPTVPLRSALDVPALELEGCAPSQAAIPSMLTALRQIDGVRRVTLQQSVYKSQTESAAPTTATDVPPAPGAKPAGGITECSRNFQAVVFFDPKPAPAAPAAPAAAVDPAAAAAAPTTTAVSTGGAK